MVIRATSLVPEMSEAFFRCAVCGNEECVEIEKGRINEPGICSRCQVTLPASFVFPFLYDQILDDEIDALDSQSLQIHRKANY